MSFMFEVYYRPPVNLSREANLTERVLGLGGRLEYREESNSEESHSICLTYDFEDYSVATRAAEVLRQLGEHVEGPMDYGP